MEYRLKIAKKMSILALGAESAGNFCLYHNGKIYHSPDFGDLLEEINWVKFKKSLQKELKIANFKPKIILSDLHPDFRTTIIAKELAKKYKAEYFPVQHHIAHIFSAIGDKIIQNTKYKILSTIYAIACDGTGLGMDGKIWGGEVFRISNFEFRILNKKSNHKKNIERIGHLENQMLIGGDLAICEPARMLISILLKVKSQKSKVKITTQKSKQKKDSIFQFVKKYYTRNEFELIYNQLQQNFNCQETSSTGRILDAVSILLGFCGNVRNYKHEPIDMLEKNSGKPYANIKPETIYDKKEQAYILLTTPLFKYLIKNIKKDKRRLAATAQFYIAQGLYKIIQNIHDTSYMIPDTYFSGGMANNKIISTYLKSKGVYTNKKIPRGDAGISFGQVIYYLLANPRN